MSVLSQYQIDDLSPFAPPRWIPAYAGMTVVVQSTHRGRGEDSGGGIGCGVPLTLTLSHVGERGFLHRPAALGIPCGRIAARRGHTYLHFWVVY